MVITTNIRCDICGQQLRDNEMQINNSIINIGNKPTARSHLDFKCDGHKRSGDLCGKCSLQIRDFIDKLKYGVR